MNIRKLIGFIFLGVLVFGEAMAKDLAVTLKLVDIYAEKTADPSGDAVYFNITQYSNLGHSKEGRVPAYPGHWLSKQLPSLKNLTLWRGSLKENESIKLILSLGEQESSAWEVSTSIGAAQLTLENKGGKLKKTWTVPIFEEKEEVEMLKKDDKERFVFKGAGSRYDVGFEIE